MTKFEKENLRMDGVIVRRRLCQYISTGFAFGILCWLGLAFILALVNFNIVLDTDSVKQFLEFNVVVPSSGCVIGIILSVLEIV